MRTSGTNSQILGYQSNDKYSSLPAFSVVLFAWRTTSLMHRPMHLHGLKMEILDYALPDKQKDFTLMKCKLNTAFGSRIDVLIIADKIEGTAVLKDSLSRFLEFHSAIDDYTERD
jgi:hypothetical protein